MSCMHGSGAVGEKNIGFAGSDHCGWQAPPPILRRGRVASLELIRTAQPGVVQRALSEAGLTMNEIDGIAFTRGPGNYVLAPFRLLLRLLTRSVPRYPGMPECMRKRCTDPCSRAQQTPRRCTSYGASCVLFRPSLSRGSCHAGGGDSSPVSGVFG